VPSIFLGAEYFTIVEHALSLLIPADQVAKTKIWKQRMFDWGLKTALLWIIAGGLRKGREM
jgi:hypothetical protein